MNTTSRRVRSALLVAMAVASSAPVMAQQPRRVAPEQLPYTWVLTNSDVSVDVPNSGVNIYKPGCVAVTYNVGSDGVPYNVMVAKVVPASDLGKAAVSAVSISAMRRRRSTSRASRCRRITSCPSTRRMTPSSRPRSWRPASFPATRRADAIPPKGRRPEPLRPDRAIIPHFLTDRPSGWRPSCGPMPPKCYGVVP